MSGNGKANINKKGGNSDISTPIEKFDEKLIYWSELIRQKYEDPNFYLLQNEHNKLFKAFMFHENKFMSKSKIFTYKGRKFECIEYLLKNTYMEFENTTRLVVFYDFYRRKIDGDLVVLASPIIFD